MKTTRPFVKLMLGFCLLLASHKTLAQTNTFPETGASGIGTLAPDASALFEVNSTTQGVLVPRMTKNQRDNIVAPATGLLIYQTSGTAGFYYYDGGAWSAISFKNGANKTLANLTEPTAVNVALLPATDNATNIGSSSLAWNELYLSGKLYLDGSAFLHNSGSENTFVGTNSGNSITTGFDNTAIGFQSLYSNNTGYSNISVGHSSLYNSANTSHNIAIGKQTLYLNQSGSSNVAIGSFALYRSNESYNHAIGFEALYENTTGTSNIAIGYQSMLKNTTGSSNIAIGHHALFSSTEGSGTVAIGDSSLYYNITGYSNTAIGDMSLYSNTAGDNNTANGYQALYSNTTGSNNTVNGYRALYSNTTGSNNTVNGRSALYSNTTGDFNTASGYSALYSNTTGYYNTANGYTSLYYNTTGYSNAASGTYALYANTTGNNNTASGTSALYANTTGSRNVATGTAALTSNTTGEYNVAVGYYAGESNVLASENSFFGSYAGENTTSSGNTMIGYQAGDDNTSGSSNTVVGRNSLSSSTASNCTAIGYGAGNDFTPGDNCTFLGYDADVTVAGLTNSTAIGNGALVIASNNMRFGNSSVIGWGFGTSPSTRAIKVGSAATNGNGAYLTVGGVWTDISDASKKENITELDKESILEKIQQLKVSKWMYTGTREEYHIGPMAAEFHQLFEVGDDSSISAMDKTGVLFLGIQALSEEDVRRKTEDGRQNNELENLSKSFQTLSLNKDVQMRQLADVQLENEKLKMENGDQQKQLDELKSKLNLLESDLSRFSREIDNPQSAMTSGFAKLQTSNIKPETILGQNIPNPFDNSTLIPFRIPKDCNDASIMITNTSTSQVISVIPISCNEDHLRIDAGNLASGVYSYTLYIDGIVMGTKQMVIQK